MLNFFCGRFGQTYGENLLVEPSFVNWIESSIGWLVTCLIINIQILQKDISGSKNPFEQ